jgi:ATP-binding cassette subfamily F protein 3
MSAQAKGRRAKLARLPRLSPPPGEEAAMALRLETAERGGDQVLVADKLSVSVGSRVLVREFSSVARRGDVIALVGPNGAGKTTLLATLLGDRPPSGGTVRLGSAVSSEWFRQDLAQVPTGRSLYDCIADLRPQWGRGPIQNHLGCFGFSGDDVLRSTAVLSGGERARTALALLTLGKANLLVLDEPTNHLDVESIEALEDALEEYEGSVLLVSHDRAFLRELVTRVWWINNGKLEVFDGTFVEWESWRENRETGDGRRQDGKAVKRTPPKAKSPKPDRSAQVAIEAAVQAAEGRVAELEAALMDAALYDGSAENARKAGQLKKELEAAKEQLDRAMEAWV